MTLLKVLLRCLAGPFFAATLPRLGLVIFRCGQPILIEQAVRFVQGYTKGDDAIEGYWLVVAAAFVYLGQTVSIRKDTCGVVYGTGTDDDRLVLACQIFPPYQQA